MTNDRSGPFIQNATRFALVAAFVGVSSWAGMALTRQAGSVSTIWLANGFLIGILLRTRPARWPLLLIAGFVGNVVADALAGDTILVSAALALCNIGEILLTAWPLFRLIGNDHDPIRIAAFSRLLVPWVIASPIVPSLAGASIIAFATGSDLWPILKLWYPADLFGIVIVTPFVLALNARVAERLFRRAGRRDNQLALIVLTVTTVAVFAQSVYPLLFVILPPLLLLVFRMGLAGAALGLIIVSAISIGFTIAGLGPLSLVHFASIPERVLLLQFFIAVSSLMAYPVGVVLTERKRLQRTLIESERRYRTLADHSTDIIVRASASGTRNYLSPSITEILGWSTDEFLGSPRIDLIHPDDRAAFATEVAELAKDGRTATRVYRCLHKCGHYVWMESSARRVRGAGPDGEDEVIKVVRDVSRRKQVEEALARSERDLRAVTDNLPGLIAFVDPKRRIRFANATHEAWIGRTSECLIGAHLGDVLGPRAFAEQLPAFTRALEGERVEFDSTLTHDGQDRHVRVSYVPQQAGDGSVTGVYALTTDQTAVKAVQQQLIRMARFDALTGLANRHQFTERLDDTLAVVGGNARAAAVMFLDIDRFKQINDAHGHGAGDTVLREFARRLQASVRSTDLVARLAGDEFVIVLDELHAATEAEVVARKVLAAMAPPFEIGAIALKVTTSLGIAFVDGAHESASEVLHRADMALYQAKAAGRNLYRLHRREPAAIA